MDYLAKLPQYHTTFDAEILQTANTVVSVLRLAPRKRIGDRESGFRGEEGMVFVEFRRTRIYAMNIAFVMIPLGFCMK